MKKSLSRFLWKELGKQTCDINLLEEFQLNSLEQAKRCLKSAFNNCRNRKACTPDLLTQFIAYESKCFTFVQSVEAQTFFMNRSIELSAIARDTYANSVVTSFYQNETSNKRRRVQDDSEEVPNASSASTSSSTSSSTPALSVSPPQDVWSYCKTLLRLGKDDERYHKYSALRNGVITLGDKIKPQRGVDEGVYNTLKEHLPVQDQPFEHTDTSRLYLTKLLATRNVKDFEMNIRCLPQAADSPTILLQDLLFAIVKLIKNKPNMEREEKNYADGFVKPLMDAMANTRSEEISYENREASLLSINHILKRHGLIKDSSEGYKADGILKYQDDEILLVELCGAFRSTSRAKLQFDRHKGMYGVLGMLKYISEKYCYASLDNFSKLKIYFIHTKESELQLWSIQFINNMFFFQRVTTCVISGDFKSKAITIGNVITFASTVLYNVNITIDILEQLINEHNHITSAITLGVTDPNNAQSLKNYVKPMIRHLTEKKDSPGLFKEDPVSFYDDDSDDD